MKANYRWLMSVIATVAFIVLFACQSGEAKGKQASQANTERKAKEMQTYYMGRFSVSLPPGFQYTKHVFTFRRCEIREFEWEKGFYNEDERLRVWNHRISQINKMEKPNEVDKTIMEIRMLPELGRTSRAVYYYGDSMYIKAGYWDVFVDKGRTGLFITYDGKIEKKESMLNKVIEISKAYQSLPPEGPVHLPRGDWFYTRFGAINLPFYLKERAFISFENRALNLNLSIETNETFEAHQPGILERLGKAVLMNFAPGLKIDKIRAGNRTVAGLKGEEIVMRGTDKYDTEVRFGWHYPGKNDSGEHPEIQISMESPDGNIEEKLRIWDAILDSFKPMYKPSN